MKTVVCGPYLGVCMHLLREGELWVVLACHFHLDNTRGSSVEGHQHNLQNMFIEIDEF